MLWLLFVLSYVIVCVLWFFVLFYSSLLLGRLTYCFRSFSVLSVFFVFLILGLYSLVFSTVISIPIIPRVLRCIFFNFGLLLSCV